MHKHVLFIQGGGDDGYKADREMVESLQQALGNDYKLSYPELQSDESLSDFGWPGQIAKEIDGNKHQVILVGHSLGASLILKCLSEIKIQNKISGIFLLATPFWTGDKDWVQGLKLQSDFAEKLPVNIPIFLYHSQDDEEVPFSHLAIYAQKLPEASIRERKKGGHQFNNELNFLADDIQNL